MSFRTLHLAPGAVVLLDQRRLPQEETYLELRSGEEVARAIEEMAVRGAPAIGVAAAMGVAVELERLPDAELEAGLEAICARLLHTRPTAVNLRFALERMRGVLEARRREGASPVELRAAAHAAALRLQEEDVATCRAIGDAGARLVPRGGVVLTHCNAGALATAGYGTALGVVRSAAREGRLGGVLATETRPFLQGARLTAWELQRDGIPVQLITDAMAGSLMREGRVQVVLVGADRIAANGDVANKIGTYGLAVLARSHGIPFYVAAPLASFDPRTPTGAEIPIEERSPREVLEIAGVRIAPEGVAALHPAFDVTPSELVTAIVTEKGVVEPPLGPGLQRLARDS